MSGFERIGLACAAIAMLATHGAFAVPLTLVGPVPAGCTFWLPSR